MTEKRHLTPSEMRAISLEARADYQAAVAEAREIGQELDDHSRLKAQVASGRASASTDKNGAE